MLRRTVSVLALGFCLAMAMPGAARAGLTSDTSLPRLGSSADFVEAHQYRLPTARVAGNESTRQTVTAWEVTRGSWNGQNLGGLSLVLVNSVADDGHAPATTNCYISHLATAAQRDALVSAYLASQSLDAGDTRKWRFEPAVIRLEIAGKTVIVHLGLVA